MPSGAVGGELQFRGTGFQTLECLLTADGKSDRGQKEKNSQDPPLVMRGPEGT